MSKFRNIAAKALSTTLAAGLLISGSAFASDLRPYVGAKIQYGFPGYKKNATGIQAAIMNNDKVAIDKKKPGLGIFAGARLHENFSLEVGADHTFKAKGKNTAGADVSAKIRNFYADAIGHLPMTEEFEALASVGIGHLKPKIKSTAALDSKLTDGKTGLRLGIGAAYKFDENVAVRATVNHQRGPKESLKKFTTVGLGVFYTF